MSLFSAIACISARVRLIGINLIRALVTAMKEVKAPRNATTLTAKAIAMDRITIVLDGARPSRVKFTRLVEVGTLFTPRGKEDATKPAQRGTPTLLSKPMTAYPTRSRPR